MIMDLYGDPFEKAEHDSENYRQWMAERMFAMVPVQAYVGQFLATFREFPQRQEVGSFSLDKVLDAMQAAQKN